MENMGDWEQKDLVKELSMGRELARQLQLQLNVPSSSRETRDMLVQKIITTYEKALSVLNFNSFIREPHSFGVATGVLSESPPSRSGSPRSEDSDKDLKDQEPKDGSRKRKTTPRWTQQVRVNPGMGLEGPLDDGFSWRKYGQKDILGAKYPRGYYRCTHRIVQGCLATKQVQRSDDDPTIFEITYHGKHTCTQASHMFPSSSQPADNQEPNATMDPKQPQESQDHLMNLRSGLKVITQDLDSHEQSFPPFDFPSSSNIGMEKSLPVFSPSMMDDSFMGNFSSSGTNYFSLSSSSYGGTQNFQTGESAITDLISAATSSTNSPTIGLDFPFNHADFDPNFTFDNSRFHP